MDDRDGELLDVIQQQVPLVPRPFEAVGSRIGMDEAEVLRRVEALKAGPRGIIRQISAIFDSRSLGYTSCLVAAKIDEPHIAAAAAAINEHPGVSHNYLRDHAYNVWYTLAVPPDSRLGLDRTVEILHRRSVAKVTRLMPALKVYKIGVKFDLSGEGDLAARADSTSARQQAVEFSATDGDKAMIRVLQQDLPIVGRPFDVWAEQAGITLDELLAAAARYQQVGCMRRFSAVLRHREAGFAANAMGAWVVPPRQHDEFANAAVRFSSVSHCYLRPTYDDWPYSIFTMVHGKSPSDCEQVLAAIAVQTGVTKYAALYSTHEYKKLRVRYFTDDIRAWEKAADG